MSVHVNLPLFCIVCILLLFNWLGVERQPSSSVEIMRALNSLLCVSDLPGRPATLIGSVLKLLQAQKPAACVSFIHVVA